jgi:hypothetical protein
LAAAVGDPEPSARIGAQIADAIATREGMIDSLPHTPIPRELALNLSVVNRGRDLICGVLGDMPFVRTSTFGGETRELGAGWLEHPDPTRTRQAWTADVVDDLIFYGWAACLVTSRDPQGFPTALVHLPWNELAAPAGHRARNTVRYPVNVAAARGTGRADWWEWHPVGADARTLFDLNVIVFESPLTGVLSYPTPLLIALRLDRAAARFAASTVPIGWLEQVPGSAPLSAVEWAALARAFADAREGNAIAALNEAVRYHESTLDPSRMQLVEGRTYQDAALARTMNVPAFLVGAVTPGDSMTYKSAQQSRWDLLSFGVGPYMTCLAETLSMNHVSPRGTTVALDPTPFLRTAELAAVDASSAAALTPSGAP